MILQHVQQELGQSGQRKQPDIQLTSATARTLGEQPAQPEPSTDQQHGQGHQQKTVHRVGRGGGPAPNLASTAVTGLNAKTPPIQLPYLAWRHVQMDEDKKLPGSPTLQSFGAFSGGGHTTDHHLGCSRLASLSIAEGVLGAIAFTTTAESACAPHLAANRTGNQGRDLLLLQESLDLNAGKAAVQQQTTPVDIEPAHSAEQIAQGIYSAGGRW
jgi:hypothetical protein